MSAVAVALVGCSVQESTRSGGLIAPASTKPAPTVVTVLPDDNLSSAISSVMPDATAAATHPPESTTGQSVDPTTAPVLSQSELDAAAGARHILAEADPPPGFGEGVLGVTGPAGTRVWPVIVADTPQSRQRGLMGVTDFSALGGYAAMVFIFEGDTSGAFWMRDTPLPLRITFVAASGSVVSGIDMAPCLPPTPSGDCERYHPAGPYRIAIEHPLGAAFDIGLTTAEFVEVTVE